MMSAWVENLIGKEKEDRGGTPGRLSVMALVFAILLVRGHGRLIHADLWAEDGAIFLRDALQAPLQSILMPYAGYLQVATRMLAMGVSFLPLEWIPTAVVLASYGLFSALVSAIVGEEYAWIIPTRRARVLCAVLLCFAPGLNEILGNMTNLHWLLLFWLCLLSLKESSFRYRVGHLVGAGIAAFSTACGLLLIPVFAHRTMAAFRRGGDRRLLAQEAAVLGFVAASLLPFLTYLLLAPEGVVGPTKARDPGTLLALYLHGTCRSYLLYPWIGSSISALPFSWPPLAIISLAVTAAGVVSILAAARRWRPESCGFLLLLASIPALIPLVFVTRNQPVGFFLSASFWWQSRYSFITVAVGILGWMALLSKLESTRRWRHALEVFFIVSASAMALGPGVPAHGKGGRWAAAVPEVRGLLERGEPRSVRVALYPDGWFMDLRAASEATAPSGRGVAEAQAAEGSR